MGMENLGGCMEVIGYLVRPYHRHHRQSAEPLRMFQPNFDEEKRQLRFIPHPGSALIYPVLALKIQTQIDHLHQQYRHFIHPHLLTSNGKAYTFLGAFQTYSESSSNDRHALKENIKLSGLKPHTTLKYFMEYTDSLRNSKSRIDSFIGPGGKGASASPNT